LNICLADVFTELGEHDRARLRGFHWLIARGFDTTNVEGVQMGTRDQTLGTQFSISDMLHFIEPMRSMSIVLNLIASNAVSRDWFVPGSLLGLKMLVALSLLSRRGLGPDEAAYQTASRWIASDPRYAPMGVEEVAGIVDRAVRQRVG
jgi:hypothetical protein